MIDYDGRRFSPVGDGPHPTAHYHQRGDLLWGDFTGGDVRHGCLAGTVSPDDSVVFGYTMVLSDGRTLVGRCRSVPELLPDGRVRFTEHWQRFGDGSGSGISYLEELT